MGTGAVMSPSMASASTAYKGMRVGSHHTASAVSPATIGSAPISGRPLSSMAIIDAMTTPPINTLESGRIARGAAARSPLVNRADGPSARGVTSDVSRQATGGQVAD
jgi:hypothetical protein